MYIRFVIHNFLLIKSEPGTCHGDNVYIGLEHVGMAIMRVCGDKMTDGRLGDSRKKTISYKWALIPQQSLSALLLRSRLRIIIYK